MADFDIYLGEGDTAPALNYQLLVPVDPSDPDYALYPNGKPADLTGATVTFKLRDEDQTSAAVSPVVSVIGDPLLGNVRVTWTGYTPGRYTGRFKATLNNGQKISFRNDRLLTIDVTADP